MKQQRNRVVAASALFTAAALPTAALLTAGLFTAALLTAACEVPGIVVSLPAPDLPDHYSVTTWIVRWWDGVAVRERLWLPGTAGGHPVLSIPLSPAGAVLPVVVVSALGGPAGDIPLAPYGGYVLPGDTALSVDRHGGEVAEVLLAAAQAGIDPALINVPRLDGLVRSRLPRNPRRLDRARLVEAFVSQAMRSYHVVERRAPLHEIRFSAAVGSGIQVPWTSDDPREDPYQPVPAGVWEIFSVPVMEGEVRRLWRPCPESDLLEGDMLEGDMLENEVPRVCFHVLLVHRTPAGNSYHSLREVRGVEPDPEPDPEPGARSATSPQS